MTAQGKRGGRTDGDRYSLVCAMPNSVFAAGRMGAVQKAVSGRSMKRGVCGAASRRQRRDNTRSRAISVKPSTTQRLNRSKKPEHRRGGRGGAHAQDFVQASPIGARQEKRISALPSAPFYTAPPSAFCADVVCL